MVPIPIHAGRMGVITIGAIRRRGTIIPGAVGPNTGRRSGFNTGRIAEQGFGHGLDRLPPQVVIVLLGEVLSDTVGVARCRPPTKLVI